MRTSIPVIILAYWKTWFIFPHQLMIRIVSSLMQELMPGTASVRELCHPPLEISADESFFGMNNSVKGEIQVSTDRPSMNCMLSFRFIWFANMVNECRVVDRGSAE